MQPCVSLVHEVSDKFLSKVGVGPQRTNHFVVNRCIEQAQHPTRLLCLLQSLVSGNVFEVEDLAFLTVKNQVHARYNDNLFALDSVTVRLLAFFHHAVRLGSVDSSLSVRPSEYDVS